MKKLFESVSERKASALKIQSAIIKATGDYLRSEGFVEILPVIISPITDPLRHATGSAIIEYYNHKYQLTKSMIFHKQLAILTIPKIFCYSPNIRFEPVELADTGKHLVEFVQLDLEVRDGDREDLIRLGENLVIHTLRCVKDSCKEELELFKRELRVPNKPFERISYEDAYDKYGGNFEAVLSQLHKEPFWIIDVPLEAREFYDRESEEKPGYLVDMDLIWPEGYGEALSGGEREYEYDRIIARIKKQGLKVEDFIVYLQLARQGLCKSAGFGLGIERFTRYVCGAKRIEEVTLFPKTPGELGI
ncbi:MAG: asparagine synthetase A [Candidatus Thermoplasmatota archaeon]|nr:asparagine synthetase A [Candidatus Thermoplasmatota archaeon]